MDADITVRRAEVAVGELPTVLGDPTLLQVVFQNLIANGIKFVGAGAVPRVEITSEKSRSGYAVICVTDNGLGIRYSSGFIASTRGRELDCRSSIAQSSA